MPQIWMTYGELAGLLGCGWDEARDRIRRDGLDRRKSRDGRMRVKLSLELAGLFIAKLKGEMQSQTLDEAVDSLRGVHAAMATYEDRLPQQQTAPQDRRAGDDSDERSALAG